MFAKPLDEQKEEALLWSMMFLVIGVAAGIAMAAMSYTFGVSGERLTLRLRDMVFRAYLKQVCYQLIRCFDLFYVLKCNFNGFARTMFVLDVL